MEAVKLLLEAGADPKAKNIMVCRRRCAGVCSVCGGGGRRSRRNGRRVRTAQDGQPPDQFARLSKKGEWHEVLALLEAARQVGA